MSLDLSRLERVRQSGGKTIARCPACAETGNDSAADHLFINADNKYGCVLYQGDEGAAHRKLIFELAGKTQPVATKEKSIWTAMPSAPLSAPAPVLTHFQLGTPSAHWTYRTNEGRIAGITARFETAEGKETRPMAWCKDQHGRNAWQWKAQPEPRTIYGLPFTEDFVVIVEGEKTADAVIAAGLPATTYQGGSGTVSKSDWSPLAGKRVCIWPDNDKPGSKAKDELLRILAPIAAEIRVIQIPAGNPRGWDAANTTADEIRRLVDEALVIPAAEYQKPEIETPQPESDKATTPGQRATFEFVRADQLNGKVEIMDFVEGLLTESGSSVLYGPSNTGKTFWIVDLGVAVASGTAFRGELEVEQGAVIYIALEGAHGAKNRIRALKESGKLKPGTPFYLIFDSVSLLEIGHAARLAETVTMVAEDADVKVKLVIIDTMARAMAGGDENSGKDMTSAVSSIDAVRAATEAHVCVVHHCGKDEAKGARGHSSLRAAVDTEIEVTHSEGNGVSTVRVTKQRDLPIGEPMPFTLKVVTLGINRRGKPITSCVVQHEASAMASKPGKAGRKPICTADDMLAFLPAESAKDWLERVKEETGLGSTQFYAHKKLLTQSGKIRIERGTGRTLLALEMNLPALI